MAIRSCRAEMIGLSERDRTLLRSLLAASQARTGMRWDGGASQPGVHFIDLDGQEGADFWQSLDDFARGDATIVLSTRSPAEGVRWLPKPLRSAALLSVLETLSLPARQPAVAMAPTAAQARVPRVPAAAEPHSLLDYLDRPPATTAHTLQSPHWPDIVLASGNTHAMRTAPLDNYAEGFIASLEVSRAAKYTGGPMDDELRIDLDTLRWLALLYAPIGEIGAHLPYPKRARLRKLPAFGQLPHKLQHVRLAAWLVQHPATPQELAEMIGADEETVQRFLGACAALGLLDEVMDEVPQQPPVPQVAVDETPLQTIDTLETPAVVEVPEPSPVAETPAVAETLSLLERLRATREQNRARVAAAISNISGN